MGRTVVDPYCPCCPLCCCGWFYDHPINAPCADNLLDNGATLPPDSLNVRFTAGDGSVYTGVIPYIGGLSYAGAFGPLAAGVVNSWSLNVTLGCGNITDPVTGAVSVGFGVTVMLSKFLIPFPDEIPDGDTYTCVCAGAAPVAVTCKPTFYLTFNAPAYAGGSPIPCPWNLDLDGFLLTTDATFGVEGGLLEIWE